MTEINTGQTEHIDMLKDFLGEERIKNIICLESTGSTNLFLKDLSKDSATQGTVVIADEQTKGRGRLGRSFESPKDKGLYMSYLMKPKVSAENAVRITAWTAVAVCNAVKTVCKADPGIKWVNDLILSGKKFCGILCEMSLGEKKGQISDVIAGIGINVNGDINDLSEDIRYKATSLKAETGRAQDRIRLAAEIIKELDSMCLRSSGKTEDYLKAYKKYSIMQDKEVYVRKTEAIRGDNDLIRDPGKDDLLKHAHVIGINDDFSLLVRYDDGSTESLDSGEVSIRGMHGYI
ncbi:MAG: biotin--[acetyl-CoA-carboxylase] ligase [Lachnospiraceae bacterium]|nr:biotin--[acetyl-CoA-carboxylase] ligase [Lachnospiraceae bacterium]